MKQKAKLFTFRARSKSAKRKHIFPISFALFPIALMFLAVPACSSARPGAAAPKKDPDPLLERYEPKKGADGNTTQTKSVAVPPVPEYQSAMSTAGLASGLDGARPPLAIPSDQPKPGPGNGGWTGQNNQAPINQVGGNAGGVKPGGVAPVPTWNGPPADGSPKPVPVLMPPQPINLPETGANPAAGSNVETVSAAQMAFASNQIVAPVTVTYEQLQVELKKRGVLWPKEEQVGNVWRFSCSVPNAANPKLLRHIHTQAADLLTAIQWALEKIDSPPR